MTAQFWFEMVGYLASVLIAISLTMRTIVPLRIINALGCLALVVYGMLIHAYPVAVLNGFVFFVDVFYLVRMYRQKDYLQLLEVSHDSAYLGHLLEFYKEDIRKVCPDYVHRPQQGQTTHLILRNMVPAGVIIQQRNGADADILLDYVLPTYRDFRVAQFFFRENAAHFHRQGIDRFTSAPGTAHHAKYLERMGFQRKGSGYVLELGKEALKDSKI